ncbi:MAG: RsmE family RNA methyltransferase [Phycisphaera sp.]|nr:RsmE family RNA methyltransferase [Phycisphaera sp.]
MALWLHAPLIPAVGDTIALSREEARHALGARRLAAGDEVTLFDGHGSVADARITGERGRDGSIAVEVVARRTEPRPAPEVTIAFAVPKGDRLSTLLDLATQAGATRFVPIECARSVVDADKLDRGERWHRILLESTKVAKRAWAPELAHGGALLEVAARERDRGASLALAHTAGGTPILAWLATLDAARPRTVFIGPEGGFEDAEVEAMRALGAATVSLGPHVMRVETAAVAAAVLCASTLR